MVSSKEALKARVAVYKEAMDEAAKGSSRSSSKYSSKCRSRGTSEGARWAGELVVIELDDDENESHDEGAYAAF